MAPCAVLVGAPAVGKSSIIRRICGPDEKGEAPHEHGAAQAEGQKEDEAVWSVDTKYYTAQVGLCELQVPPFLGAAPLAPAPTAGEAQGLGAPPQGAHAPDWSSCEALVLVFDLAAHGTFLALQAWWSSAAKALKGARALDVQLCVGNKADSVPHHPAHAAPPPDPGEGALVALEEQRRGYMEWCLDRGFEYIEASALDPGFDARLGPAEGDSANSQGIARLRAALQAHMWSGMSLKDSSARLNSLAGPPGALNGGAHGAAGEELSSDEEEGDGGDAAEEFTPEELGSLLGYVQLGDGQEEGAGAQEGPEPEVRQGPEPERPSSWGAAQGSGGAGQQELPDWGPYQSTASSVPPHPPGLEGAGEGGGGSSEERAGPHDVASQPQAPHPGAAHAGAASWGPEAALQGLENGSVVPGSVAGPSMGLTKLAGHGDEGQLAGEADEGQLAGEADEGQLQSLEQLLGRVAAVREQGASLPDSARREMAAATALQLAALLCGEDDDA